jgi:NitT/TauT family transport system ATP-binding protein
MIEVDDLHLRFAEGKRGRENRVIDGISLRADAGESLAIIGPSGCGKSSLLFILAGLIEPTAGRVVITGQPVTKPRPDVALILQETGLLPWKTVWQNATLGLSLREKGVLRRIKRALRDLGLEGMEHRYPTQLSGGEKKRVSLARALAQNAQVLLMDEPLVALDTLTKEHTQNLILKLWGKHGFTLVLVTHDIEEAVFLGERIVILSPRPARVLEVIENPGMGTEDYRQSPPFFEKVREVRALLQV